MVDLESIPVIDTHEHVVFQYKWAPEQMRLPHLLLENHYLMNIIASSDPASAGREWDKGPIAPLEMIGRAGGTLDGEGLAEAMRWFTQRLPKVAHTSDWAAEGMALADLFGLDDFLITADNWQPIDARVRAAYADRQAWHSSILQRAHITTLFWCYKKPLLAGPCRSVLTLSEFGIRPRGDTLSAEKLQTDFLKWLDDEIAEFDPVAFKVGSAYSRDIEIVQRSPQEVEKALNKLTVEETITSSNVISDYIHDLAADACGKRRLPIQVHTGYLAGNAFTNPLHKTYAARMEPFIARHPGTLFDIFHGSFPQWGEAVTLARRYPNVYLNTCWVPSTSESMAEAMLDAALDAVPANKIMWGGDAHSVEMAYGILKLFRGILSRVLEKRRAPAAAKHAAAEWILWRSAAELYNLDIP